MNDKTSTRKKSPTSIKNFEFGAPVEASDFDRLLDKLEAKYDATIVLLATEDSPGHDLNRSEFTEQWFFEDYYDQNGFIVLEKDVGKQMGEHVLAKRTYGSFRFNLPAIASGLNMRLSPNGIAFDPEKKPPKQVARECLAECLAFIWEVSTTPSGNQKVLEDTDDLQEDLETMKVNCAEILKYNDEDLGIKMGTRKDLLAFIEYWHEYVAEAANSKQEKEERKSKADEKV